MNKRNSLENIEFRHLSQDEFRTLFRENRSKVFSRFLEFRYEEALSQNEKDLRTKLQENISTRFRIHLAAFKGKDLVGWSLGTQIDGEKFCMVNSAVFPEYRRLGI